mgnify:FL=1
MNEKLLMTKHPRISRITVVTRLDPSDLKEIVKELLTASRALSNAILTLNTIISKPELQIRETTADDNNSEPDRA